MKNIDEKEFLQNYNIEDYERPSVTIDVVAFTIGEEEEENYRKNTDKKLKVLLMQRTEQPNIGKWALPGGFVDIKEQLEQATSRVLENKTDLSKAYLEQLYTFGDIDRDPRYRIFSISYLTLIQESNIKAKDKNKHYEWFDISTKRLDEKTNTLPDGEEIIYTDLLEFSCEKAKFEAKIKTVQKVQGSLISQSYEIIENENIAFDHAKIIHYALKRLREKIEYTPIAFSLMPKYFTLTQLQQVYEVILGKELLKANFRRKIANMVIETDEYKKDAGHRPSKLYKFNSKFN